MSESKEICREENKEQGKCSNECLLAQQQQSAIKHIGTIAEACTDSSALIKLEAIQELVDTADNKAITQVYYDAMKIKQRPCAQKIEDYIVKHSEYVTKIKEEPNSHKDEVTAQLDYELEREITIEVAASSKCEVKVEFVKHVSYIEDEACLKPVLLQSKLPLHGATESSLKERCHLCNKYLPKNSLKQHCCKRGQTEQSTAIEKKFICDVCEKSFNFKICIIRHLNAHNGVKPFHCDICKKRFTRKTHLTRHEHIHSGHKPFCCGICRKQFARKSALALHERVHYSEKPYSCEICRKQFTQKSSLTKHKCIHKGEKQYSCGICQRQFTEKSTLTKHERTHTGEKPFKCGICKKLFAQKSHLTDHERIHSGEKPFHCKSCSRRFAVKTALTRHERFHSGEKLFHCVICSKQFSRKVYLTEHERIHSGVKPFCCDVCQRRFTRKTDLTVHQRLVHS